MLRWLMMYIMTLVTGGLIFSSIVAPMPINFLFLLMVPAAIATIILSYKEF